MLRHFLTSVLLAPIFYGASCLYFRARVSLRDLRPPRPRPLAAGLSCPFVLYSAIAHFCLLVVQIAPRPPRPFPTSFLGRFSAGNERGTFATLARRRRFSESHLQTRFLRHFRHVSIGIVFCLPELYDSCAHSDFLADYHVLFCVSNGLVMAFGRY